MRGSLLIEKKIAGTLWRIESTEHQIGRMSFPKASITLIDAGGDLAYKMELGTSDLIHLLNLIEYAKTGMPA